MITAIAALLTAITGMVVALHQMGMLGRDRPSSISTSGGGAPSGDRSTPAKGGPPASSEARTLPAGGRARAGEGQYEVLAAQVDRAATGVLELRLTVRVTNLGRYPGNYSPELFRLLADGVPLAPTGETTIDVVDGGSAKNGLVVFDFPDTTHAIVLQVGVAGMGTNTIPLSLEPGRAPAR